MGKALAAIGLVVGLASLGMEYWAMLAAVRAQGQSGLFLPAYFASYFTNLVNIGLLLAYLGALLPAPLLSFFRAPAFKGFLVPAIALVGLVYHFVLAAQFQLAGLLQVSVIGLHYLTPAIYLVWWAFFGATGTIRLQAIGAWVFALIAYFTLSMLYEELVGQPVYPFLDAATLGPEQVALTVAAVGILYLALCVGTWAFDRHIVRRRTAMEMGGHV